MRIKEIVKKFGFRIVKYVVPQIIYLKKPINWNALIDYQDQCTISKKSQINSPFHLINLSIGDYSYIDINSQISQTHIGKFCSIGPNFVSGWGIHPTNGISTAPMFYSVKKQNGISLSKYDKIEERKQINIGNDVFIGMNVTVLDGISIGDGAIIGAGAVVSKDIPPFAIAIGSPIKIVKYRFEEKQIEQLLRVKWWNFNKDQLNDVEKMFFDLERFLEKYDV